MLNLSPDNKILDSSTLKAFGEDKINQSTESTTEAGKCSIHLFICVFNLLRRESSS